MSQSKSDLREKIDKILSEAFGITKDSYAYWSKLGTDKSYNPRDLILQAVIDSLPQEKHTHEMASDVKCPECGKVFKLIIPAASLAYNQCLQDIKTQLKGGSDGNRKTTG